MIFSTLNQLNCFLIFLFYGITSGIFISIFFVIFLIKQGKILKKIIFEAIFYSFHAIHFNFLINLYNLGKFSLVLLLGFILGLLWAESTCKKLVVFLSEKWYNYIKARKLIKQKHEHKPKES